MSDRDKALSIADPHQLFRNSLEQATDAVFVLNADNHVLFLNAAAEALYGASRKQVVGMDAATVVQRLPAGAAPGAHPGPAGEHGEPLPAVQILRADGQVRFGFVAESSTTLGDVTLRTLLVKVAGGAGARREDHPVLSVIADEIDSAVLVVDADWRIVYVNAGLTRMLGYAPHDMVGRMPCEVLAGEFTNMAAMQRLQANRPTPGVERHEALIYASCGSPLWVSATVRHLVSTAGQHHHGIVILSDITQKKTYELLQRKVLHAMVMEQPLPAVLELICQEVQRVAPSVIATVLRVDSERRLRPLAAPALPPEYAAVLDGLRIGPQVGSCGTAAWLGEAVVASDISTDPRWVDYRHLALPLGLAACWSYPIKAGDGRVLATLAFYFRSVRAPDAFHQQVVEVCASLCKLAFERDDAAERIQQLDQYDSLTGLPNRSLLQRQAGKLLLATRQAGAALSVLFVDLDRFKYINDSLGHSGGDKMLREVAKRLTAHAGESALVARLSGDEFALVLPESDRTKTIATGQRLLAALRLPLRIDHASIAPSASIGISLFPSDGDTLDYLLHCAEMAMYDAKAAGRNLFRFFSIEMNWAAQERLALESALREALLGNELHLNFQPQVFLSDGRLYGLEVLVRWHHPHFGKVPPDRFVPLAEDSGLIGTLDRWVLERACAQMAAWRRDGIPVPTISVNISPASFRDPALAGHVAETLSRHGLPAQALVLEMTEGLLMEDDAGIAATVAAIHAQGVRLSMDDFGTGYSSLGYLRQLPVHQLKLDKSFVIDLESDAAARELASAVIRIGDSLKLAVVAEGVENEAQRQFLLAQGCHMGQGYLFSRPLDAGAVAQWINTPRPLERPAPPPGHSLR
ncbi:EAL domain-containing protein [Cupriavidus sp. 2TAF22]|uniref:EAL domain-containing protein n=1 Tax=unclassified Cupriavidus TaxID=2640874 RepID=UPI003F90A4D1